MGSANKYNIAAMYDSHTYIIDLIKYVGNWEPEYNEIAAVYDKVVDRYRIDRKL